MEANPRSLSELMGIPKRFVIPEYQRPFVWTKEEVLQLWRDLNGSFVDAYQEENADAQSAYYFLGSVVVANKLDETRSKLSFVIDGQQRLTTLTTLLWTFHHSLLKVENPYSKSKAEELHRTLTAVDGIPKLRVAARDAQVFHSIRENGALDETMDLGSAAALLRKEVEKISTEVLIRLSDFILNCTRFIHIQTDSFSSAWELFIGLNGKGRPLDPADLIKAFICGNAGAAIDLPEIWERSIVPLGNDSTSAILAGLRVATGKRGSEASLFTEFEKAWNSDAYKPDLLATSGIAYQKYWNDSLHDRPYERGETGKRHLRSLRVLGRGDHSPVLIALAAKYGYEAMFRDDLLAVFDAYQFWMAANRLRGREQDFADLASLIFKSSWDLNTTLGKIRQKLQELHPSPDEVKNGIRSLTYAGRVMKHVVLSYEEGQKGNMILEDIWYEHLMPQTPTDYWLKIAATDDKNEYSRIVDNIANIVPLDAKTNIRGRNDDWSVKRELYLKHVPNWGVSEIARQNPERWGRQQLETRLTSLATWCINERWNLPQLLAMLPDLSAPAANTVTAGYKA